jgi:hypothetical protein
LFLASSDQAFAGKLVPATQRPTAACKRGKEAISGGMFGFRWNGWRGRWFVLLSHREEIMMRKYLLVAAAVGAMAAPAFADDIGAHVGPVGAGVTVGQDHYDRDRDRDRTTVIKEREPTDRTTVIKKERDDGVDSKTVIHHDND